MDDIGRRLRERREAIGMGQAELARRAGMDNATLNRIETGKTASPRLLTIRVLDQALREAEEQAPWATHLDRLSETEAERRILPAPSDSGGGPPFESDGSEELPVTAQTLWALFHLLPGEQKQAVLQDLKHRVAIALQEEGGDSQTPKS